MRLHPPFPRPCSVFVGRVEERQRVLSFLDSEVLFLIYGIAGIGKSEFVYHLAEAAQTTHGPILPVLVCAEPDQTADAFVSQVVRSLQRMEQSAENAPTDGPEKAARSDWNRIVDLLEQARQPRLLCFDDLHLLADGAASFVAALLGHLSRYVRRSRVMVCARSELALPPSAPVPVVVRLLPLSASDSSRLVKQLCERLGQPPGAIECWPKLQTGIPQLIRETLLPPALSAMSESRRAVEPFGNLSPQQRQILLLASIYSGSRALSVQALQERFPTLPQVVEDLRELSARFLLDLEWTAARTVTSDPQQRLERAKIVLSDSLWTILLANWGDTELNKTRREVASLLLARFVTDPQQSAKEGIEALQQLMLAGCDLQAVQVLRQIHRSLSAAWRDWQLLTLLATLRARLQELPMEEGAQPRIEVELLLARLLLHHSQVDQARSLLSSMSWIPQLSLSAQYLSLVSEAEKRGGRLDRAKQHLTTALEQTDVPRDAQRIRLQLAQMLALQGDFTRAHAQLQQISEPTAPSGSIIPLDRLRWHGAHTLTLLLEDKARDAIQSARELQPLWQQGIFALESALYSVCANLALDRVSDAQAVLDQILFHALSHGITETELSAMSVPMLSLLRGVCAAEKGELMAARTQLAEALRIFDERGDALTACIAQFYLARVLYRLGDLPAAQSMLLRALGFARQVTLGPLLCRIEILQAQIALSGPCGSEAKLALLRVSQALTSHPMPSLNALRQALSLRQAGLLSLQSPQRDAELRSALQAMSTLQQSVDDLEPATRHLLALEHAELLLLAGPKSTPMNPAWQPQLEQTLAYYARQGRPFEEARAALALAWLLILLRQPQDLAHADATLAKAQELCTRHAFRLLHLRGLLLDAAIQMQQGHARRSAALIHQGVEQIGTLGETLEAMLLCAAAQDRETKNEEDRTQPVQLDWMLSLLGLRSELPFELVTRSGRREMSDQERAHTFLDFELIIEPDRGSISRGGSTEKQTEGSEIGGRPLLSQLLCSLFLASTEGASAERLFYEVWGGRTYHPLQHRNTIYVAIGRLRQALRELLPGRDVIETTSGGWRFVESIAACVIRKNSRERNDSQRPAVIIA